MAIGSGLLVGGWEINKAKRQQHLPPMALVVEATPKVAAEPDEDWSAWVAEIETK